MRRVTVVCAVVLGLCLVRVGEVPAATQGKRIALLTGPNQDKFIGTVTRTFIGAAEKAGMRVTNLTSPFDAALQAQQVDDAIAQKFDMLVIQTLSEKAIVPALTRAKRANVPVMLIIVPLKGSEDLYVSYVGVDHGKLGRLTGESVARAFQAGGRKGGRVALVTGVLAEGIAPMRVEGFKEALAKHPEVQIAAIEDGKWNPALSEKIAGQLFARFAPQGGLDAMYGMNDGQANAIIQAAKAAGINVGTGKGELLVVGSNCQAPGIENIRAGRQYSTNTQSPSDNGTIAAERVADFFNGKMPKRQELIEVYPITKENVEQYAAACTY